MRALSLWAPVAAWMALIFVFSSRPLPPPAGVMPDWVSHASAYALLALLACRALAGGLREPLSLPRTVAAIALCSLYGISDEWHQSFVPSRSAEARDVMSNTVGAAVAAAAFRSWPRP